MSRRESRSSISNRQNDALQEFESFKRKYLQVNKHIVKINSQLQVKIEELNDKIAQLTTENLTIRATAITLTQQLSKERERNKRSVDKSALAAADNAAATMIQQLEALRQSLNRVTNNSSPGSSPYSDHSTPTPAATKVTPVQRARPSVSTRVNLIARAPDFSLIREGDSEDEEEAEAERILALQTRPTIREENYTSIPSTSNVLKKKPNRRQSGLVAPVTVHSPTLDDPASPKDSASETDAAEDEVDEILSQNKKPSRRRSGKVNIRLVDVTNSPPQRSTGAANVKKNIMSVLAEEEAAAAAAMQTLPSERSSALSKSKASQPPVVELTTSAHHVAYTASEIPHPSRPSLEGDVVPAAEGRSTRTRKSVNYAEPKLNIKMRKPDEPSATPYAQPSMASLSDFFPTLNKRPASISSTHSTPRPSAEPILLDTQRLDPSDTERQNVVAPVLSKQSKELHSNRRKSTGTAIASGLVTTTASPAMASSDEEMRENDDEDADEEMVPPSPIKKSRKTRSSHPPTSTKTASGSNGLAPDTHSTVVKPTSGPLKPSKSAPAFASDPVPSSSRSAVSVHTTTEPVVSKKSYSNGSSLPSTSTPAVSHTSERRPASTSLVPIPTSSHSYLPANDLMPTSATISSSSSRKRKAAPTRYSYMDIDSDDEAADGEDDGEYMPIDRRKSGNVSSGVVGGMKTKIGSAAPGLSAGYKKVG